MRSRRGALSGSIARSIALAATALAVGAAVSALGVLGACGAFDATSDDVSDGAPPSADASGDTQQPTTDGSSADAPANPDAGVDAMGDGGCAHDFCADFEGATAQEGWSLFHTLGGATFSIAPGVGLPGNALRSSVAAQDAPQYAYLTKDFPGAGGVHIELDIKVPNVSLGSGVLTLVQFSGLAGNESGVGIQLSAPTTISFFIAHGDGSSGSVLMTDPPLPRGVWVHLILDLHFGIDQTVLLELDGMMSTQTVSMNKPTSLTQLRVGVQHYTGTVPAPIDVLYDNVRVDVRP